MCEAQKRKCGFKWSCGELVGLCRVRARVAGNIGTGRGFVFMRAFSKEEGGIRVSNLLKMRGIGRFNLC